MAACPKEACVATQGTVTKARLVALMETAKTRRQPVIATRKNVATVACPKEACAATRDTATKAKPAAQTGNAKPQIRVETARMSVARGVCPREASAAAMDIVIRTRLAPRMGAARTKARRAMQIKKNAAELACRKGASAATTDIAKRARPAPQTDAAKHQSQPVAGAARRSATARVCPREACAARAAATATAAWNVLRLEAAGPRDPSTAASTATARPDMYATRAGAAAAASQDPMEATPRRLRKNKTPAKPLRQPRQTRVRPHQWPFWATARRFLLTALSLSSIHRQPSPPHRPTQVPRSTLEATVVRMTLPMGSPTGHRACRYLVHLLLSDFSLCFHFSFEALRRARNLGMRTLEPVIPLRLVKGIQIIMDMDTGESMCYEYN